MRSVNRGPDLSRPILGAGWLRDLFQARVRVTRKYDVRRCEASWAERVQFGCLVRRSQRFSSVSMKHF